MENQFKERFRKMNPLELVEPTTNTSPQLGNLNVNSQCIRDAFGNRNICIEQMSHSSAIRSKVSSEKRINLCCQKGDSERNSKVNCRLLFY